ncbi:MAG TPA: zinc-dependent peptidase [Vicinamibacteria bacterium]|nr:zinc-dependent peptidase [Vicinamibacteria bacterium]
MNAEAHEAVFFSRLLGGLAVLSGAGLGGLLAGRAGAVLGGLLSASGAVVLEGLRRRREVRRRLALAAAFPAESRAVLEARCDPYLRLPSALRSRFEDGVRTFLADTPITGIEVEVTEELRLLVAASAVTLSVAWPRFEWDHVAEVLLYPRAFDRDYSFEKAELIGQAHPWGTVILSVPALKKSFQDPHDGYHVGFHEFAHLLDMEQRRFGGIPAGLNETQRRRWGPLVAAEMESLREGRSLLDPYGVENPAEFFAVSIEVFFEQPQSMRRRHEELYETLSSYFRQDPAAWDDARGLTL